jgi:hypothetical protein
MKKSELKEMIKKAISEEYPQYKQNNNWDEDYEKISREIEYGINPEADEIDLEDLEAAADYYDDLEEAKKKEETEIEVEDTEEIKPMNDVASDGENMKDLQSNLEAALEIAKQIGVDLKVQMSGRWRQEDMDKYKIYPPSDQWKSTNSVTKEIIFFNKK